MNRMVPFDSEKPPRSSATTATTAGLNRMEREVLPADVEPEQRLAGHTKRQHAIALALTRVRRDPLSDVSHPFQCPTL